jgi:hypothetical protein
MKKEKIINDFLLLNYIILITIPLIFTILIISLDWWWYMKFSEFLFLYGITNAGLLANYFIFSSNFWSAILFWLLFKYIILIFYASVLKNRKKTILAISIILWLLSSFIWYVIIWIRMSV